VTAATATVPVAAEPTQYLSPCALVVRVFWADGVPVGASHRSLPPEGRRFWERQKACHRRRRAGFYPPRLPADHLARWHFWRCRCEESHL